VSRESPELRSGTGWYPCRLRGWPCGCGVSFPRAHEDPGLLKGLSLPFEGEQGADLEVAGSDVGGLCDRCPLFEIA
jgi:hypothetical protein